MILSSEEYENWITSTIEPRFPELVHPIRDALSAFDQIQAGGIIEKGLLEPIEEIARSHRRPLYELAADFFQELTVEYAEARECVARMAKDKQSQVRFNAVICTGRSTPRDFSIQLIKDALSDKSAKVRQKAADWAERIQLREIVPDLERAIKVESHVATKETMQFSLPLLRDGYLIEDNPDGSLNILVTYARGIKGRSISRDVLENRGISSIVAEMREAGM